MSAHHPPTTLRSSASLTTSPRYDSQAPPEPISAPTDGLADDVHSYQLQSQSRPLFLDTDTTGMPEKQAFLTTISDTASSSDNTSFATQRSHTALWTAWWSEILALLLGTGALVAIIITLVRFNGKEQPAWKYSVNLNTLIAILSTFLRVCLLFGIEESECVSLGLYMLLTRYKPLAKPSGCATVARIHFDISLDSTAQPVDLGDLCCFFSNYEDCMRRSRFAHGIVTDIFAVIQYFLVA